MSTTSKPLVNRVAASGLITFKLEEYLPSTPLVSLDLKDYLFQGLILREKDFREAMEAHEWEQYSSKVLLVHCSADAIVPLWAFMLVAAKATPFAADVSFGSPDDYYRAHFAKTLAALDVEQFRDQRVIIKGCSDRPVPVSAYVEITKRLRPLAKSIMYGEPCSTVPIFKQTTARKK